ncbi:phage holin family protein [Georgenia sp. Z1344]|uniref:phage holin family protein n=1 Tax=Georgenia sp. Z1344 TaxID=3416706 RepID=UPI003CF9BADB
MSQPDLGGVDPTEARQAPGLSPNAPNAEPSVGELFSRMSQQVSALVKGEINLAKTQATEKISKISKGAVFLAVAGVLALYGLGMVFLTATWGIAEALPLWLSALIVTVAIFLVVGILALVGIKTLNKHKQYNVAPQEGLKEDVAALKKGLGSDDDTTSDEGSQR